MEYEESQLQREIRQGRPFRTKAEEATISILHTADMLRRRLAMITEPHGITPQQYNVLRILRGSHPKPLPTLEIGERLIERMPGITRLLDRLEEKGLVHRVRCAEDRRQVHCSITPAGLELLARLDEPIDHADVHPITGFTAKETATLINLLDRVRRNAGI